MVLGTLWWRGDLWEVQHESTTARRASRSAKEVSLISSRCKNGLCRLIHKGTSAALEPSFQTQTTRTLASILWDVLSTQMVIKAFARINVFTLSCMEKYSLHHENLAPGFASNVVVNTDSSPSNTRRGRKTRVAQWFNFHYPSISDFQRQQLSHNLDWTISK